MNGLWKNGLAAALVLVAMSGLAQAQNAKKAAKAAEAVFEIPKEITLTDEQKAKLEEIKKEQSPKVSELQKKLDTVLTAEQKAARKEATSKAKADGKKGKDLQAAVDEAMKLTDEQKKQRSELQPELAKLQQSIKEQIHGLLTDEQKTHYKLPKAKKAK
jgi:Skp family chaperone for outer membrane proteins